MNKTVFVTGCSDKMAVNFTLTILLITTNPLGLML